MTVQSLFQFDSSVAAGSSASDGSTKVLVADILIVGGGIVGATLACCLAEQNLRVVVVDANPQSAGLKNQRAYALTLLTIEIFQDLGIWSQIKPQATGFTQIYLADAEYDTVVRFLPKDIGCLDIAHLDIAHLDIGNLEVGLDIGNVKIENLGYVAEHGVILQSLYDRLARAANVTWIAPARIEATEISTTCGSQSVTLRLENDESLRVEVPLVVGADGANSSLRQGAQIDTWGWKYWQSCIGFTVQCDRPHHNIAYEKFWRSGPFALLPLPHNRCQIVWTAPHAEAEALANLPETEFLDLLAHRYGVPAQELRLEKPRQVFPVRLMQSQTYISDRLALIGDAAHCCHPVGGQGMNLGIRDAAALAEQILTAQKQGKDWGSRAVLQKYDRWRRWENWVILAFTDLLDRVFSNKFWPLVVIRHLGLWGLQRFRILRWVALHLMTGQFGRKPKLRAI